MNPSDNQQPAPNPHKQKVDNALTATQQGEQTIFTVARHPIGLILSYLTGLVLTLAITGLAFAVIPAFGALVLLLAAILCAGFSYIITKIYWGNTWILTSDSLTQVAQSSLFNRESSQLSLGNLEDISAEQKGILSHLFNYGLLKVETAGEKSKFAFTFCPNPNYYAQQVLMAREKFEQGGHASGVHHLRNADQNRTASVGVSSQPTFLDPSTVNYEPIDPNQPRPF